MSDSLYGPLEDVQGDAGYAEGHPPRKGFFTDTSVCIGCKACEVACKEWNAIPEDGLSLSGMSYDNTEALGASTWRHVAFIEKTSLAPAEPVPPARTTTPLGMPGVGPPAASGEVSTSQQAQVTWLMSSDVCKHCTHAACLDVCPTGSLFRTEFGTVVVQEDICNGCGYCVPACPYGVIDLRKEDGRAFKCTLCYDRLKDDQTPACAKACPTESIQFGDLDELRVRAQGRVEALHERGVIQARLYGHDPNDGVGGDGAFFLLLDEPEVYGLPPDPVVTTRDLRSMWSSVGMAAGALVGLGVAAFRGVAPVREQAVVAEPEFESYYGRQIIKTPTWKSPDVPLYLFLGGLAGASAVLAQGAALGDYPDLERVTRLAAAGGAGLGTVWLIHDLGRPARFLNMLRMLKVTSPLSVGSWLLAPFATFASGAALSQETAVLPVLGRLSGVGAAVFGPFLATYTGALLANTAVPVWHEGHRELPFVFAGSSAAAAGGLAMLLVPAAQAAPARRMAAAGAALDVVSHEVMERRMGPLLSEPYRRGTPGLLMRIARGLTVTGGVLSLIAGRSRAAALVGGAACLAGSVVTRFGVFEAGLASARDPKYTVIPQKERLAARDSQTETHT